MKNNTDSTARAKAHHIALLIDMQNIYLAQKQRFGKEMIVDYKSLMNSYEVTYDKSSQLLFAKAFLALHPDHTEAKKKFLSSLQKVHIEVISKECKVKPNGHAIKGKSNMDVEIALHATQALYMPQVDTIVLASGDGDFSCIAELAKSLGKRFEVMGIYGFVSNDLKNVADKVTYLDKTPFLVPTRTHKAA